jgi:hypothetical protein
MPTIETAVDIDAPRADVWQTLTDFDAYGEWNPHLTTVEGSLTEGGALEVRVERAGAKPRELTVTLTAVDRGRRLVWVGTVGFGSLFEGRHVFELEPLVGNRTRLHNREDVSGLLSGVFVTATPERDYEAMNEALKRRVESRLPEPEAS